MVPEFGDVERKMPKDYTGDIISTCFFAAVLGGTTAVAIAPVIGMTVACLVVYAGTTLSELNKNENRKTQTTNEKIREHRCCIQCRQPTERLVG